MLKSNYRLSLWKVCRNILDLQRVYWTILSENEFQQGKTRTNPAVTIIARKYSPRAHENPVCPQLHSILYIVWCTGPVKAL